MLIWGSTIGAGAWWWFGGEEETPARHLNVVKNKLSGWHGVQHCELDYLTARYL